MNASMKKIAIRRICADFTDDEATEIEMMEVALGIHRIKGKSDRDAKLINVAFMALKRATADYRHKTGKRYPDADELTQWLNSHESSSERIVREITAE